MFLQLLFNARTSVLNTLLVFYYLDFVVHLYCSVTI